MRDEPLGSQEPGALGLPTAQSCRERAEIRQGGLSPKNPGLGRGRLMAQLKGAAPKLAEVMGSISTHALGQDLGPVSGKCIST